MPGVGRKGRPPKTRLNPIWTKAQLTKMGISQADLAKAAGVAQSTVEVWLNGKRELRPKTKATLEKALLGLTYEAPEPKITRRPHKKEGA